MWLSEHPQVFFSAEKEPHFFNTDHAWILTPTLKDYERYFLGAKSNHLAVGEGSVWYLYSKTAVLNIEKYSPGARYIVCLRNPIDMAYSLHEQQVITGNEHIKDFALAWRLKDARLQGKEVSHWCVEPSHLAYGNVCKLGEQLQRLYKTVPSNRVFTVLLDDLKDNPRQLYLDILYFLNLDDDDRCEFQAENMAKKLKSISLRKIVRMIGYFKQIMGVRKGLGILKAIDRYNIYYRPRQKMDRELKLELIEYFKADIKLLEKLLNRDLSFWIDQ